MSKRIRKSENVLGSLLAVNDKFYVGINFNDFEKSASIKKYSLPNIFTQNQLFLPAPKGSITKVNIDGKKVRKQPEEKETKTIEINFVNKNGTHVHYMRDYNVYVKIIAHQYKATLKFVENPHNQKIVVSPVLIFDNEEFNNIKNTHIINMFYELFNDYEIYTENLEPALAFNKNYDFVLLPKGELNEDDVSYIVEGARRLVNNENDLKAFQKRLQVIKEYNPDIRGKGPDGFRGYIVFGFKDKGFVILESMYMGNASYIFDFEGFENLIAKNKQDILDNKLVKKRFFHYESWEKNIRAFLEK